MVRGKKFILIMLSLAMVLAMAIGFAACNNGPKLEAVPAKDASCEYDGNIAYWKDPATGKFYSDEAGEHEIAESDTVIAATGHTYADTWSSDDTNHWHQATCEHSDKIRDRAEHTYPNYLDVSKNEGFTGKELLPCTVCGHERTMEEAYQMYVIGGITSYPTSKWDIQFTTKDVCSKNCPKMTYDEATGTFSLELILDTRDRLAIYNLADGNKFPARASDASFDSLRVEKRSTYIISWKPADQQKVTVTEHEHTFTKNNYKYTGSEHWIECDNNDGAVKPDSTASHDLASGACVCGFSPATCTHEDGYVFSYHVWDENPAPAPEVEGEGGTLKKVCPYCFKEENVTYDVGYSVDERVITAIEDVSKTYYMKGRHASAIGIHFTEPGVYTLSLEVVCNGAVSQDQVRHHTLKTIIYSTESMPKYTAITGSKTPVVANKNKLLWYYSLDDDSPWYVYDETKYPDMKAAVENWKNKIVINGDPDYHFDKTTNEMVNLDTITFTIEQSDLGDNGIYFGFSMALGTSMATVSDEYALLAKVTKAAAPAPTLAPQPIALLPQKKNY